MMKLVPCQIFLICLTILSFSPVSTSAQTLNCTVGTNNLANPSPQSPKPQYLAPFTELTYHGLVKRITNDAGVSLAPLYPTKTWQFDARHHYSKDQPWNADGSLLAIHNSGGGSAAWLYLNGNTYEFQDTIPNRTDISGTFGRGHGFGT